MTTATDLDQSISDPLDAARRELNRSGTTD
jgi:hypothetical protein